MYSFLKENWRIAKWVALGAVVFEVKKKSKALGMLDVILYKHSGDQAILPMY